MKHFQLNHHLKKILNFAGSFFAVVGIFFIGLRLYKYSDQINYATLTIATWYVVIGSAIIYGAANLLLGCTWKNILKYLGVNTTWRWALRTYGISQLAKYMPGNIFHLAGRQSIGIAAGLPGWALAKSIIGEIGLISLSGCLFGSLVLPLLCCYVSIPSSFLLFISIFFCIAVFLRWYFGAEIVRAFVYDLCFLAISGMIFVCILAQISHVGGYEIWTQVCGAYVIAWLAGLLTPGAPAGVGVRELALLFFLRGFVGESDLLLSIMLGRLVTVFGDILFFFFALLIRAKS